MRGRHQLRQEPRGVVGGVDEDGGPEGVGALERERCGDADGQEGNEGGGGDMDGGEEEGANEDGEPFAVSVAQAAEYHASEDEFFKEGGHDDGEDEEPGGG